MTVWYIARGAGLSAVVLLSVATCLGALVSARLPRRPGTRVVVQYMHRAVASTALAVLGLHITMILADSFAHVGVVGALVPFQSAYRALWVGLGSIAAYTVLLVAATGFLRARLTRSARAVKVWRSIHAASYGAWALAMLHGFFSGTDSGLSWVRWMYLLCLGAVAASVTVALIARRRPAMTVSRTAPARSLAVSR
jgi:hypothetical protein